MLSVLQGMPPETLRAMLPGFLAGYIGDDSRREANLARVGALVSAWDDETCEAVRLALLSLGEAQVLYSAHPAGRALSRAWVSDVLTEVRVDGAEHLRAALAAGPTVIACNHLAYFDASATDAALASAGHADLADKIAYLAGPKVYEDLFRRVAASCLNNVPVPQSTTFSHTEALPPRELARRALASLSAARDYVTGGGALLLYPEGSRTRSGQLGPFLKATWRYVDLAPGLQLVPMTIVGTDRVMPVDAKQLSSGPVTLQFARALAVGPELPARTALAEAWQVIAQALPAAHRPPADIAPLE